MTSFGILRRVIFAAALVPAAALVYGAFTDDLTANPIDYITDTTGTTALSFLILSLTVTPLRRLTGRNELIKLRRMLGLFAFFYACLHLAVYVAFVSFHAVYIHSNTRWRFPVLRWIVATPEYHHWHHTSDEEGLDKNFASFLPLWDWLFGTLHLPDHWPKNYGTVKFQPPERWVGQFVYPFKRKKETPYG